MLKTQRAPERPEADKASSPSRTEAPKTADNSVQKAAAVSAKDAPAAPETGYIDGVDGGVDFQDPAKLSGNYRDVYRKHRDLAGAVRKDTTSHRTDEYAAEIGAFQKHWATHQKRYEALAKKHDVPAALIAALHKRESDSSFGKYLAQGVPLGKDPRDYKMKPYHRVMYDWDESADYALEIKKHHRDALGIDANTRDPAALATYAELWNGTGYHGRNLPSGYIYAGTDAYKGGHFPKDGTIDMSKMSAQPGIYALMEAIGGIDGLDLDSREGITRDQAWSRVRYGADRLDGKSTGEGVAALQERLSGNHAITGKMDAKTLASLHALQKQSGIAVRNKVENAEVRNLLAPELWTEMAQQKGGLDIKYGSAGLSAQLVQQVLAKKGKYRGNIDGLMGPGGTKGLKAAGGMQGVIPAKYKGLAAGAQVTENVPRHDVSSGSPDRDHPIGKGVFKHGSRGSDVESIQTLLGIEVDGKFGDDTTDAVRQFQIDRGLKPDGKVGEDTRAALYERARKRAAAESVEEAPEQDVPAVEEAPEKAEPTAAPQAPANTDTSEIDALLQADWGKRTFSRDRSSKGETELLQRALTTLGYIRDEGAIDGAFGPNTANALMAFQVATSGVDTIEHGTDSKGRKRYAKDHTRNRLKGIVDGRVGPDTRKKLMDALKQERERRITGTQEPELLRSMGDTPEQKQAIAERMQKAGLDPQSLMSVDTRQFEKMGLRPHVLDAAIDAWENQYASGAIDNTTVTVNDLELPANMRRSFTLDLADLQAGLKTHAVAAHGSGTGRSDWAQRFSRSQVTGSNQCMLGAQNVGGRTYHGGKRFGLTVDGLEPGINDRADKRLIRVHGPTGGGHKMLDGNVVGRSNSYKSAGCIVLPDEAATLYHDEAEREGGRFNFNFASHEHYWGKQNAVNSD